MTVASEISRLQQAKSDIKAAIESKGVSVESELTIDYYADIINNMCVILPPGFVDFLMVGGGGSGGSANSGSGYSGGGGGGGVIYCSSFQVDKNSGCEICIGNGQQFAHDDTNSKGGDTTAFGLTAYGGGRGGAPIGTQSHMDGHDGGSGGGGSSCGPGGGAYYIGLGGKGTSGQGFNGGCSYPRNSYFSGGGGGGAGGAGGDAYNTGGCCSYGGAGGCGYYSDISGTGAYYGTGGGGASGFHPGCGGNGSGNAVWGNGGNATCYGGGGGGSSGRCKGGNGCQGIVIIRYKTDGSCCIKSATGGTKYTCGDYTIHCFTSSDTFCIVC